MITDYYWRGRSVREMTREELLDVVLKQAVTIESYQTPVAMRARALGRVEMLKRGERRPGDRD